MKPKCPSAAIRITLTPNERGCATLENQRREFENVFLHAIQLNDSRIYLAKKRVASENVFAKTFYRRKDGRFGVPQATVLTTRAKEFTCFAN